MFNYSSSTNAYTWIVSFVAGIGGLLLGYEGASGLELLQDREGVGRYATYTYVGAAIVGTVLSIILADTFGRKTSMIISDLLYVTGAFVQTFAPGSALYLVGRGIFGCVTGSLYLVIPIYITEIAPTNIRGAMSTVYQFMWGVGFFIDTIVFIIFNNYQTVSYRISLVPQLALAVLFIVLTLFYVPHSPRWLASKGRHQ
jgi:SP family galactose:H+ symporter-like MFS transporter